MAQKFVLHNPDRPVEVNWPVQVNSPRDGGEVETDTFTVRFRVLPQTRYDQLMGVGEDAAKKGAGLIALMDPTRVARILEEVVVGFSDIVDADGNEISFSAEMRAGLIDMPNVRTGLMRAYRQCAEGHAQKN